MYSAARPPESFFDRLARWLKPDELAGLPEADVERMARDLGIPEGGLRLLASSGPDSAALLYERMAALGLTEADLERMALGLTRTLEVDCSCCSSKDRCAHDLATQAAAPGWMSYCANAGTLQAASCAKGRPMI
jgi:hypothetical protein